MSRCRELLKIILVAAFVLTPEGNDSRLAAQQVAQPHQLDWDFRYELFQSVLEEQGLTPVQDFSSVRYRAAESVVVLLGRVDWLQDSQVEQFCSNGGAMLIARDSRYFLGSMCSFRSGAVTTNAESAAYQGHRDCIMVTDINSQHRLMTGIGSLVVNKAGFISRPRWQTYEVNQVAAFDDQTNPAESRNKTVVGTVDAFRESGGELIVCSDQSLFTNGMLWHADNSLFAINVARLLSSNGRRRHLHILVDGQALSTFADSPLLSPEQEMPLPPLQDFWEEFRKQDLATQLDIGNTLARAFADSNLANQVIAEQPRNVIPPRYRRAILFGFGLLTLLILFWLLLKRFARAGEAMPIRKMQTAYALRTDKKISESNFGYAASMLARDFCRELTDSGDRADWLRTLRARVSEDGSPIVQKVAYQAPLNRVVDLAVNSQKITLSTSDLTSLGEDINTLRNLHRDGKLLISTGET
ncbi:MAG: hypothetical protein NXI04_20360 [Planctomycetaceae bacterium]|nr:hypothetical protein [Planctomycetaceae bacterium]